MSSIVDSPRLPNSWTSVRLGEVCEINPRRPALVRRDDEPTTFVPMAAVDEVLGTISKPEIRPYAAVKKGYTWFAEGDVLFAKITPCMQNGKHAIARCLLDGIGFGTTEFHVIRPSERVIGDWVHYFVRQPQLLEEATSHFSGAVGQQRLPDEYLREIQIPLPPLPEQRRIVAILNSQTVQIGKFREALSTLAGLVTQLPGSVLKGRFSSKVIASAPRKRLGELCNAISGGTPAKDRAEFWSGDIPWITVRDMKGRTINSAGLTISEYAVSESGVKVAPPGTVLVLVRGMGLAKGLPICEIERPCAFNQDIKGFASHGETTASFLAWALRWLAKSILRGRQTVTHGTLKLDTDLLLDQAIPVPDLETQEWAAKQLNDDFSRIDQIFESSAETTAMLDKLPPAVLRRAFSGGI